jgi:hypothetical protein
MLSLSGVIGFEADSIRRWSLERKGWNFVGTVVGRNAAECERRFFETWLPRQPVLRVPGSGPDLPRYSNGQQSDRGLVGQPASRADATDVQVDLTQARSPGSGAPVTSSRDGFWSRFGAWFSRRRPARQS